MCTHVVGAPAQAPQGKMEPSIVLMRMPIQAFLTSIPAQASSWRSSSRDQHACTLGEQQRGGGCSAYLGNTRTGAKYGARSCS